MPIDLPPQAADATPPAAIVAPAANAAEPIFVDSHGFRYAIRGNVVLPPGEVVAAVESGAEPKDAIEALRRAFIGAGYPLTAVRAEVSGKLVAADILNGRLTDLDMPADLIPYYSPLVGRELLRRNELTRASAVADFYTSREGMRQSISFSPGTEALGSKLTVTEQPVEESKRWNASFGFNNLGSRYSSRYVAQASGAVRPGGGLELNGNYTLGLPGMSPDSSGASYNAAGGGVSVVTPWGLYSGTYQKTLYQLGESAAPLFPVGDIGIGSISGSQLVYADDTLRIGLTEGWTHTDNVTTVFDGLFKLTDQHYDFLSFGVALNKSFALFGESASLAVTGNVSAGITPRRGSLENEGLVGLPNPRFAMVQGNLTYTQTLPGAASASLTWSGQWADSTMPQNQQWVLGGFGNLTAWLPAIMVGDSGTLTRASVTTPTWRWGMFTGSANAFAEGGMVATHYTPPGDPKYRAAADAGIAASAATSFGTALSVAYAWPIWTRNVSLDTLNTQGRAHLYFSLAQSF